MNCPSRTDDTILHGDWNQNPSSLATDLTTCQDFNGMVNSRTKRSRNTLVDCLTEGIKEEKLTVISDVPGHNGQARASTLWSWIVWLSSVLIVSFIFSNVDSLGVSGLLKFSKQPLEPKQSMCLECKQQWERH